MTGHGILANRGSLIPQGEHNGPSDRERMLSEIAYEKKRGNWKRAADLKRHYDREIARRRRESHEKR